MKTITIADGELKDKIKIHNRKNLYKEIGLCAPKVKINTSPFLNTSTAQINKVRVVLMKVTSTDKILTRYWQTSYNHLEWKTREQQTNRENEITPPPLLRSSHPPPPGERSGPIRGEITNSADSWSNPTLTFLLRWKEENSRPTQNFVHRPRNNETEKATAISINASCNGWARVQKSPTANLIRNKPSYAILATVRKFYALFNLIGATVTEGSDNVHTNFRILI